MKYFFYPFGEIMLQKYVSEGISHAVFYSDLVCLIVLEFVVF